MNLEIIVVSEISQRKTIVIYIIYIQKLKKMIQMNLFIKQKEIHMLRKLTFMVRGKLRGGITCEFRIEIYTLLYLK